MLGYRNTNTHTYIHSHTCTVAHLFSLGDNTVFIKVNKHLQKRQRGIKKVTFQNGLFPFRMIQMQLGQNRSDFYFVIDVGL